MAKYLPLTLIYIGVLLLFFSIFSVYFSQDDFFHFKASATDGSIKSFIGLFGFPAFEERGYAFYRPLTREGLYNIYYSLFGLDHFPFRILSLGVHMINILLVFKLGQKLFNNRSLSYLSSLIFGISAINVGVLYYGAGGIQTSLVALFILLSVILFEKFRLLSVLAFVLALMSHEIGAVIPFLLFGLVYIKSGSKNLIPLAFNKLWPFALILFPYLYLDLVQIGLKQAQVQYKPVFSISQIANTFMWYYGWALGLPEMLVDFLLPGFKLNPNLLKYWSLYFNVIFPAFFILLGGVVFQLIKNRKILLDKKILFLIFWSIISIAPVVLLPQHKFVHYLAPSMVAGSLLISYLIVASSRLVSVILLLSFLVLNITSIKLAEKTYWAIGRGRIAGKLISDISRQYPSLPQGATLLIKNDPNYPFIAKDWGGTSTQAKLILNNQDAIQLFYKDQSLKVLYEDDKQNVPETVYQITAKIN